MARPPMSTNSMGAFNMSMTSPVRFARRASVSSNLQVCSAPEEVHEVDLEASSRGHRKRNSPTLTRD
eukprot:5069472-Heterocapsa_arctica.AAC.1